MADNNELQTARIANNSPGSLIDNHLANIETALATVLGVTMDSDCAPAMTIASTGDVTMIGTLTLAADPTSDSEVATKQYVDNNTSTAATVRCQLNMTATQQVLADATDVIEWDAASPEVGGDCWAAGNPSRLVVPDDGEYLISCNLVGVVNDLVTEPSFYITLKKNGVTFIEGIWGILNSTVATATAGGTVGAITTMESCSADDYFEVFVTTVGNIHLIYEDYSHFGLVKVG